MDIGPKAQKVIVGGIKGVFHGMVSGTAAYQIGMKFWHWAVIAGVQLASAVAIEMASVMDRIFPDKDN